MEKLWLDVSPPPFINRLLKWSSSFCPFISPGFVSLHQTAASGKTKVSLQSEVQKGTASITAPRLVITRRRAFSLFGRGNQALLDHHHQSIHYPSFLAALPFMLDLCRD